MIDTVRKTWGLALGLSAFFALPPLAVRWLQAQGWLEDADAQGLLFGALLLLNPVLTFVFASLVGYRQGFAWLFVVLVAIAWLPALVAYNSSALVYAAFYALIAALALLAGWGARILTDRAAAR